MLLRALKSLLRALPLLLGVIFILYVVLVHGQRLAVDGQAPLASLGSRWLAAGLMVWLLIVWVWLRRRSKKVPADAPESGDPVATLSAREQLLRDQLQAWRQRAVSNVPGLLLVAPAGVDSSPLQGLPAANEGDLRCSALGGFALYDVSPALLGQRQPEEARLWRLALKELQHGHTAGYPVRGVVLVLSAGQLQRAAAAERDQLALTLRVRLEELAACFGKGLAVQLIISGCEQLPGYPASLASLPADQRELSIEFAPASSNRQLLSTLGLRMGQLIASLQNDQYARLQREPDVQVRAMLFGFTPMWQAFSLTLHEVLQTAFGQERGTAQVALQSLRFICQPPSGEACAPAPALLRAVQSCRKGGRVRTALRQAQAWWRPRAHYLAVAACLLLSLLLLHLHRDQSRRLEQVDRHIDALQQTATPVPGTELNAAALLRLDHLAAIEALVTQRWLPWASDRQLRQRAAQLYSQGLDQWLLSDVVRRLQAQMRAQPVDEHALRRSLQVYLMLGGEGRFRPQVVRDWYVPVLRSQAGSAFSALQYAQLDPHLTRLLKQLPRAAPLPLEHKLVQQVREQLAVQPFAERLYGQLLEQLSRYSLADFSAASVLGAQGLLLFSRRSGELATLGVPGHFSVVGEQHVHHLLDRSVNAELEYERQLMGRPQMLEAGPFKQEVLALYYQSYIDHWQAYFDDLQLVGLEQSEHLPRRILQLAQKDSPLLSLLRAAGQQTALAPVAAPQSWLAQARQQGARLQQQAGVGEPTLHGVPEPPVNPVKQYFQPLHEWLAVTEQGPASDTLLSLLKSTAQFIDAEQRAAQLKTRLPANDVLQQLQAEVEQVPAQVQPLLQDVLQVSSHWLQQHRSQSVQAAWRSEVEPFCERALMGRYPFAGDATTQVAVDDFNQFFAPQGMLQGFVDEHLSASIDTTSRPWRFTAAPPGISGTSLLAAAEQAAQVRQRFFAPGQAQAGFEFEVSPLTMSERIAEFRLSLDDQRLGYAHGPLQAAQFAWPGKALGGEVQASVTLLDGRTLVHKTTGPWAWFRLLDQARLIPTEDPQVRHLVLDFDGDEVRLQVRTGRVGAPFERQSWSRFQCPQVRNHAAVQGPA